MSAADEFVGLTHSGFLRLSSPVTAAGPQRTCTVFPILPPKRRVPRDTHVGCHRSKRAHNVNAANVNATPREDEAALYTGTVLHNGSGVCTTRTGRELMKTNPRFSRPQSSRRGSPLRASHINAGPIASVAGMRKVAGAAPRRSCNTQPAPSQEACDSSRSTSLDWPATGGLDRRGWAWVRSMNPMAASSRFLFFPAQQTATEFLKLHCRSRLAALEEARTEAGTYPDSFDRGIHEGTATPEIQAC